jgi:hypothetical protein
MLLFYKIADSIAREREDVSVKAGAREAQPLDIPDTLSAARKSLNSRSNRNR